VPVLLSTACCCCWRRAAGRDTAPQLGLRSKKGYRGMCTVRLGSAGCCMDIWLLLMHTNVTHLAPKPSGTAWHPCCLLLAWGHSSAAAADASLLYAVSCVLLLVLLLDYRSAGDKTPTQLLCCSGGLSICGQRGLHARLREQTVCVNDGREDELLLCALFWNHNNLNSLCPGKQRGVPGL
jgi:hypothetical protein